METAPKKELSLFDSTCIIVGIIIGAGIYQMSPMIAKGAYNWWGVLLIWVAGGFLSLCGAICYAELATAYPREGGDYVYLSRAYGKWAGFLFGWSQLTIVKPGDIAVMAFAFATFAKVIYDPFANNPDLSNIITSRLFGGAAVVVLTAINIAGVKEGKWTQNLLTVVKALGLIAIVIVALIAPAQSTAAAPAPVSPFPLSIAMVFVLFVYGGWNEMAYVAAEVKNPNRNILRALVLGTVAVTVLYLLVNSAFLYTLGYAGLANSNAVASDVVNKVIPVALGGKLIAALVCISALGAVNGLIFTGARISYAMGSDYSKLRSLGVWNSKTGTPVRALLVQGIIALSLVLVFGSFIEAIIYTSVAVYMFYFGTTLAVGVLRYKEPNVERPYRVTGFPVTAVIFATVCAYLIFESVKYALAERPIMLIAFFATLLLGLFMYWEHLKIRK
jgi:APA family basic amino acid/polyamine antiporter